MYIFFKRENKGQGKCGVSMLKGLLIAAAVLLLPNTTFSDTADIENADGATLSHSTGSIDTGNPANIGLDSSNEDGKKDYGIYVLTSSNSTLTLDGGDVNTYGYNADGIYIMGDNTDSSTYTGNSVNISSGEIATAGNDSVGVYAKYSDNTTITFSGGTISTGDVNNIGVDSTVLYGKSSEGILIQNSQNSTITISGGSISTYGYQSDAARINGDSNDSSLYSGNTINMSAGSISTKGNTSFGLYSSNSDTASITFSGGTVTTGDINNIGFSVSDTIGKSSHALFIKKSNNGSITLSGGDIITYGYQARGIYVNGDSNDSSLFAGHVINMSAGSISTYGLESRAIHSKDSDNTTINLSGGTITTGDINNIGIDASIDYGEKSHGIYTYCSKGNNITVSGGTVTTYGYQANGVYIEGQSSDTSVSSTNSISMTNGSISTIGHGSRGIYARYSDDTTITFSGGTITTGDINNVGLTSDVEYGEGSDGIFVYRSSNNSVTLSGGDFISYGHQAHGVDLEGDSTDSSLYVNNSISMTGGSITTLGNNSRGLQVYRSDGTAISFSGGTITTGDINNVGLTSTVEYGESNYGIYINRSSSTNIQISSSAAITTYGYSGLGVFYYGNSNNSAEHGNNTLNITGGSIKTMGQLAFGIYSQYNDSNNFTFSGGTITTGDVNNIGLTSSVEYGKNSHAIYINRSNSNIINLSGTASITTYGNSGNGIYIQGDSNDPAKYSGSTVNMSGGTITTWGNSARAIYSHYSNSTTINLSGGTITSGDVNNIGLSSSVNHGKISNAIYSFRSSNDVINLSGTANITTYGYQARGILITGDSDNTSLYTNNTINMSGGAITTWGNGARAIESRNSDNLYVNFSGGTITTGDINNIGTTGSVEYGEKNHAIFAYQGKSAQIDISGTADIDTYGYQGYGVYIQGISTDTAFYNNSVINFSGGTIDTLGYQSHGLYSQYSDTTDINFSGGSISTGDVNNLGTDSSINSGESAHGIFINQGSNSNTEISGTASITTYGYQANGLYLFGASGAGLHPDHVINMSGGTIETQGYQANGIYSLNPENVTINFSGGTIETGLSTKVGSLSTVLEGKQSYGIQVKNSSNSSINLSSTASLITYGYKASGIFLVTTTDSTVNLSGTSSILTQGDDARGIELVTDANDNTINLSGNSSITAQDASGIWLNNDNLNTVINISDSASIIADRFAIYSSQNTNNTSLNVAGTNWTIDGSMAGSMVGDINEYIGDDAGDLRRLNNLGVTAGSTISADQLFTDQGSLTNSITLGAASAGSAISTVLTGGAVIDTGNGSDSLTLTNIDDNTSELGATGSTETLRGFDNIYLDNSNLTGDLDFTAIADSADNTFSMANNSSISGFVDAGAGDNDTLIIGTGQTLASADIHLESNGTANGEKYRNFDSIANYGTLVGEVIFNGGDNMLTIGANATMDAVDFGETYETNGDTLVLGFAGNYDATRINAGSNIIFSNLENILGDSQNQIWTKTTNDTTLNKIDLAGGVDTLVVSNGDTLTGSDVGAAALYRGVDNISLAGTISGTLTFESGDNTLTLNSSAVVSDIDFGETGETNGDTLVFNYAGNFDASQINNDIGSGVLFNNLENVTGNASDQTWTVTANDSSLNTIDFLAGTDTLIVNNGTTINGTDIGAAALYRGFDIYNINGTVTGTFDLSGADSGATVNLASTATVGDITGSNGNDTLNISGGATMGNLNLGTGNNIFNFNGDATVSGNLTAKNSTVNLNNGSNITVNNIADLSGASLTTTVQKDGSSGSLSANTIILEDSSLHLNAGSGFSSGDFVDINLSSIFVTADIQNINGDTLINLSDGFSTVTHNPLLRILENGSVLYVGFAAGTEDSNTAAALDANNALYDDQVINNFISNATTSELEQFVEESQPQAPLATETISLAVDTAVTAVNNRFTNLGILFTPKSSSEEVNPDESFWVEALYSKIDKENTSSALGYNASVTGSSFGYDQSLNGLTLGFAYSYYSGRTTNSTGYIESDIHQLSFYGMKEFKNFYLKAIAGGGLSNNDSLRRIASVNSEAKGDYRSYNYFIDVELGKTIEIDDFKFSPFIGAKFSHIESESYDENGAGVLNLSMNENNTDNLEALIGFRLATQIFLDDSSVLTPHLGVSFGKNFGDDTQSTSGRFTNGQINFNSADIKIEKYYTDFKAGLTWSATDSIDLKFTFSVRRAENYLEQTGTLEASINF